MRPAHVLLAVLVTAVWGVNFVVEVGLDHFPPLLFSALRFLVAALPAVFFVGRPKVAWDGASPARTKLRAWGRIVGVFTTLFAFVAAFVALGERPGRVRLLGMVIALAGIGVAAVDEGDAGPLTAFALLLGAAACWGASNVLTRKASPPDSLNFMVWVSTVPVLPLLGLSLFFEGPTADLAALRSLDWQGAGIIVYVAWITTVFGFGAWGHLLRRHPASTVAPFSLLVPMFGMSAAGLVLGESVSALGWCAAALLVGGVGLTSLAGARGTAPGVRGTAPGIRRRAGSGAATGNPAPDREVREAAPHPRTTASRTPSTASRPAAPR
ncbi:EamA family transporter [Streptomyces sp. NPDC055239]